MSDLVIRLEMTSPTPHYEQLRVQIAAMIHSGALRPGERLPTARALANDLGIAAGTVTQAYRNLEAGGLALTRRRTGTVVRAGETTSVDKSILADARLLVEAARRDGLSDGQIRDIMHAALLNPTPDVGPFE
ncbi:MAG TPA: GntR family transcriptional regulator [Friedmanniella sp.]